MFLCALEDVERSEYVDRRAPNRIDAARGDENTREMDDRGTPLDSTVHVARRDDVPACKRYARISRLVAENSIEEAAVVVILEDAHVVPECE